jgi:hypothetical protein
MDRAGAMGVSAMRLFTVLLVAICLCGAVAHARQSPFESASLFPADVKLYVSVKNAAALRKELADRPIAKWFENGLSDGSLKRACATFAQSTGLGESELFDLLLGREFTVVRRNEGEWALVTRVSTDHCEGVMKMLRPRVGSPLHNMALVELPEQQLLVARNAQLMVVGPIEHPALMREVMARIGGSVKPAETLRGRIDVAGAADLGTGTMGVYMQHDPPLGGASCMVANLRGSNVAVQHSGKFDHAPFNHQVTKLTCDFGPVKSFEDRALVSYMQPQDIGDGPVESFITASLGHGLVSDAMRQNLGDRRLVVIGEQDLRLATEPLDLLTPTVVTCFEIKDKEPAIEQLDFQMVRLSKALGNLCKGSMLTELPNCAAMCQNQIREVDLAQASDRFTGGFPIMRNVSLCWKVAEGPQSSWYVIGTHPGSLEDVVKTLETKQATETALIGKFESCGVGNGARLSRQLQSWSDRAEVLAEVEKVPEFRGNLDDLADLAGGIRVCRWKLARPSANQMRLDVQFELAEPEKTRAE